jgi:hypothetical protein
MIQSATNTQEAVAIVEERLPEKLGELPLKCNTGWVTQFGKGQLKAAFVELKKTSTKEVAAKYDNNISMITEQLKSLPKVGEPWGAIWLEVQVYGTNWWPLIEFKYEENRK